MRNDILYQESKEEHLWQAKEEHLWQAKEEHLWQAKEEHLWQAKEEHLWQAKEEHLWQAFFTGSSQGSSSLKERCEYFSRIKCPSFSNCAHRVVKSR